MDASEVVEAFRDYVGVKLHFTKSDFHFREGSLKRLTAETVLKRADIKQIISFAEKHRHGPDRIQFLISAFKENPNLWIGDLMSMDIDMVHSKRMGVVMALEYNFKSDVEQITEFMDEKGICLRDLLECKGDRPLLIKATQLNNIKSETLAIIQKYVDFCSQETCNPFWESYGLSIKKYAEFLSINTIVEDQMNSLIHFNT